MTEKDIYQYVMMSGGRHTTILNPEICGRDVHVIREEFNKLGVDYLRKLWEDN